MFTLMRGLGFTAGLALSAAVQAATAQAPLGPAIQKISVRNDCPVEPHPKAVNPDVIECHARFAPLPVVPPEIDGGNPEHLEVLRAKGDVLLQQIDRPEACGEGSRVRPAEACAILVYVIDPEYRQAGLPWTYIVKIYRINHPASGQLREMVLSAVLSNNSEQRFGPVGSKDEVWQLLAEQRAMTRCKVTEGAEFKRNTRSPSAQFFRPEKCNGVVEDVRYRPVLLIGRGEAEQVLNAASIKRYFGPQK